MKGRFTGSFKISLSALYVKRRDRGSGVRSCLEDVIYAGKALNTVIVSAIPSATQSGAGCRT